MQIQILGSGGVQPMPRATCFCDICKEARIKGEPYYRTGCSMFVHGPNLLFDTPEEVRYQLNRQEIQSVEHVVLTHWHPDHTQGLRILEQLNWDFENRKTYNKAIPVHISKWQKDMLTKMSCGGFLDYYEKKGIIQIVELDDRKPIKIKEVTITPYYIDHTKGYYFLITDGKQRIVYAMCEYHNLIVHKEVNNIDHLIVHNLFWENDQISTRISKPLDEDSFEKMLCDAEKMNAKNIYLTHIEETFHLNHTDLNKKMLEHYPKYNIQASYDGMRIG